MSFIPTGYAESSMEIEISGDGGPAYVVWGMDATALGSATAVDAALQAIIPAVPGPTGMLASSMVIRDVVTRYKNAAGQTEVAEFSYNLPGIDINLAPPPQVATLVQKISGLAGRTNRGRMYWPAIDEANIDAGGNWIGPFPGGLQTQINGFFNNLTASSIPMVILHTNPALTPTVVSSVVVNGKVATQRRRLR